MRLYTYIFLPSISYVMSLLYLLIMAFQNIYLVFLSFLLRLFTFLGFISLLVISLFNCKDLENWVSFHLIIRRVDASVYLFFTIILLCNILFYLLIYIYIYISVTNTQTAAAIQDSIGGGDDTWAIVKQLTTRCLVKLVAE